MLQFSTRQMRWTKYINQYLEDLKSITNKVDFMALCSEKAMAPHSSTLAWKIPWAEEPGRLQSMGSLRVGHDWVTSLSLFTFMHWRNGTPLQYSCLENPRDGGAWWAAVYGVSQSQTWLKRLSSSSSMALCWSLHPENRIYPLLKYT